MTPPSRGAKSTGRSAGSIRQEAARRANAKRAAAREEQLEAARARRKGKAEDTDKPTRRARFFKRVMRWGPLRRMYARRLLRFLNKSKAKGRVIPAELAQLDEYLGKLPAKQRLEVLEATLSGEIDSSASRTMRRMADRQARRSGRGGGRQRPGMPPTPGVRPRPR